MRTVLIVVERVGRCVGGMLALQVAVLQLLLLQRPLQAIAPPMDPSAMLTAIAAMEAVLRKGRILTLANKMATRLASRFEYPSAYVVNDDIRALCLPLSNACILHFPPGAASQLLL
jgi:hypothetical protein